jgi:hypothetical protein
VIQPLQTWHAGVYDHPTTRPPNSAKLQPLDATTSVLFNKCTQGVVMLMTGFPLTGALGLMMPYVPAPVMEALAFALLVSGAAEMSACMLLPYMVACNAEHQDSLEGAVSGYMEESVQGSGSALFDQYGGMPA